MLNQEFSKKATHIMSHWIGLDWIYFILSNRLRFRTLSTVFIAFFICPINISAKTVVFFGDSLTAGYGVDPKESYPSLIQHRLNQEGRAWRVVNAGVSGDTTQGGLVRLGWILNQKPDVVVIALGANDGMRGVPVVVVQKNLIQLIRRIRKTGALPLVMGVRIPTNYGVTYERELSDGIASVARAEGVAYLPFFIRDVAAQPALNLPDGIHPNASGYKRVASRVYQFVSPHLN